MHHSCVSLLYVPCKKSLEKRCLDSFLLPDLANKKTANKNKPK